MKQKYPDTDQIPQVADFRNTLRDRICKARYALAIIGPDGKLLETADAYSYIKGQPGKNFFEHVIMSKKKKKWLAFPYRDFTDLPQQLEKVPFYLKYGHFARAHRLIQRYKNSRNEKLKKLYDKANALILKYRENLIKDAEQLIKDKKPDEAYRIAAKALTEHRGIRDDFTGKLKKIVSETGNAPSVRTLLKSQRVFMMAEQFFTKGKTEHAARYLEGLEKNTPDNYYGRRAAKILNYL